MVSSSCMYLRRNWGYILWIYYIEYVSAKVTGVSSWSCKLKTSVINSAQPRSGTTIHVDIYAPTSGESLLRYRWHIIFYGVVSSVPSSGQNNYQHSSYLAHARPPLGVLFLDVHTGHFRF